MTVQTRANLSTQATTIRDEVAVGANTATRVGTYCKDLLDSIALQTESDIQATAVAVANVGTLSGIATTIDGILLNSAGDHVAMLTAQSSGDENGPWVIQSGPWTRPVEYFAGMDASGKLVGVQQGTIYAESIWKCTSDTGSAVVDTDATTWTAQGPFVTWDTATLIQQVGEKTNVLRLDLQSQQGVRVVATNDAFYTTITESFVRFRPAGHVRVDCYAPAVGDGRDLTLASQVGVSGADVGDLILETPAAVGGGAEAPIIFQPAAVEAFRVDTEGTRTTGGRILTATRIDHTDSPYDILNTEEEVFVDTDGGAVTVNLPAGESGRTYRITNAGGSGNAVTLAPDGSEKLLGVASPITITDRSTERVTYETTEGWY